MLSKESKLRVLENFYGIDYAIFGKPLDKVTTCCPVLKEEYISVKGALLSVFVEMLKLIEHSPEKITEKVDTTQLKKLAKESAKGSRNAAKQVVTTEQARADIKNELKEAMEKDSSVDASKLVESKIKEKAYRLAIDNMLVARALQESKQIANLNEWTGKIIEDSYKILRDNLCELAMLIMDDESQK